MEICAEKRSLRISPKKIGFVATAIRGLRPEEAAAKLKFLRKSAARVLASLINQALANARSNPKVKGKEFTLKRIDIGEGPRLKRMDKSHGARFDRGIIQKRTSMIRVVLEEIAAKEEKNGTEN
ncbi:50S ribosomal protein L22 [Candidatus Shapirobacteria bacterium]|nr:50S ribosomal protein L22 [Candidatus Shapirobacteria bacterium]